MSSSLTRKSQSQWHMSLGGQVWMQRSRLHRQPGSSKDVEVLVGGKPYGDDSNCGTQDRRVRAVECAKCQGRSGSMCKFNLQVTRSRDVGAQARRRTGPRGCLLRTVEVVANIKAPVTSTWRWTKLMYASSFRLDGLHLFSPPVARCSCVIARSIRNLRYCINLFWQ
jgi:hypothetical protein